MNHCEANQLLKGLIVVAFVLSARPGSAQDDASSQKSFYDPDQIQTVHLDVTDEDWQRMLSALPDRIYIPATFCWNDIELENVGIRFKGNSSSNPDQPFKRGFLIRFDKYDDDQRFLGLRRASLDNGIQFGSLFSEPIVTEILHDLEIPSHRCNYARLYLNNEFSGVYTNVERIDKSFLESRFPDPKGALFKCDLGGAGANLQHIGDHPSQYEQAFEPKTKPAERLMPLVELIRIINHSPDSEFAANLESHIELDDFLQVMAVTLFSGCFDQLTGWNAHNYYLFHDREQDRWHYLPWDLDVGFCEVAFGQIRVLEDWNAAWPAPATGGPVPLLERIIATPELLERYRETAEQILDKYFEPERLCGIIDAKYALIRDDLEQDPFPHRRVTNPEDRNYDDIVASIKTFVRKRYATAREQLHSPGERPPRRRGPQGGPRGREPEPGPGSEDAPTDLEVVSSDARSVVLRWKDNAEGEAGHLLQRATGEDSDEFRNLVGRPGGNSTEATDPGVRPGLTYRYRVYAVYHTPEGPRGTGVSNVVTVHVGERDDKD